MAVVLKEQLELRPSVALHGDADAMEADER